jgi:hypothetical protein
LGALERKLQDLELRMSAMETIPDMLDRVSVDAGATPVSDMWNFTLVNKRLTAAEEGLGKVSFIRSEEPCERACMHRAYFWPLAPPSPH